MSMLKVFATYIRWLAFHRSLQVKNTAGPGAAMEEIKETKKL